MPRCKSCNGTGKREFTVVEKHADGTVTQKRSAYLCTWCHGTGRIPVFQAKYHEMEQQRDEELGTKNSR